MKKLVGSMLIALLITGGLLGLDEAPTVFSQGGGIDTKIVIQMPFIAGQTWKVGGWGSFYGEGAHINGNDDYFATDWNLADGTNDAGQPVLAISDGVVASVRNPASTDCELEDEDYGCYVEITHTNGYSSTYAHLSAVYVVAQERVIAGSLLGAVGNTGGSDGSHLHLRFRHFDSGAYHSRCNLNPCGGNNIPTAPQGHRPGPMMTSNGLIFLEDGGNYTSVNGRVYLPNLSRENGWNTRFFVRNNGTVARTVTIYYFGVNGQATPKVSDECVLQPNRVCPIAVEDLDRIPNGTSGVAYVDGGENVSVSVVRYRATPYVIAAYNGLIAGDIAQKVFVPLVHRNNSGSQKWNSDLVVMNTGATPTNAMVYFQTPGNGGDFCATPLNNIPAKGSLTLSTNNMPACPDGSQFTVASARVESSDRDHLLAVMATQRRDDNNDGSPETVMDDEGLGISTTTSARYYPLVMKANGGWDSGLTLQNAGTANVTIAVAAYKPTSQPCGTTSSLVLNKGLSILYPLTWMTCTTPYVGSIKADNQITVPFVSLINHTYGSNFDGISYSLIGGNTQKAVLPLVMRNSNLDLSQIGNWLLLGNWNTGINVQNTGATATSVTFDFYNFYNLGEGPVHTHILGSLASNDTYTFFPLPAGVPDFSSVVVSANQNIIVAANHFTSTATNEDSAFGYAVPNR